MRSRRTDRRALKRAVERLEAENAALLLRLSESVPAAPADESAVPASSPAAPSPPAVPLAAGGYPTLAAPRAPKSLKEVKEILLGSPDW